MADIKNWDDYLVIAPSVGVESYGIGIVHAFFIT
jgi:hypothetical protein